MSEAPYKLDSATLDKIAVLKAAVARAIADANGDRVAARELLIQRGYVPRGSAE